MNILPLGARVLIRREEAKKQEGSILIPDAHQEVPCRGLVCAVGEGCKHLEGGETVLIPKYGGNQLPDDEDLLIMEEADVLAKVDMSPVKGLL